MPNYTYLRSKVTKREDRRRTIDNLIKLRERLDQNIPAKDIGNNLLLATWNIRDFGKPTRLRRGWGPRLPESWFYIAEVLSRFDFVAVQEVNQLTEWETVMKILGHNWKYIATDETDPKLGGNGERMTFVYDRRKVWFQSIAGEIVLPPDFLISKTELEIEGKKIKAGKQFRRTPFIASFQSGWLKFDICTVHLYYGASSGDKLNQRIQEINTIAKYLGTRADRALGADRVLILLGDFNIVSPEHKTMLALKQNGFVIPETLQQNPTTKTRMHYDQIAFKTKEEIVQYVDSSDQDSPKKNAGVFSLFDSVFTDDQFSLYRDIVKSRSSAGKNAPDDSSLQEIYQEWRTYQFSDHFPMWVRLKTDSSSKYLTRLLDEMG